MRIIKNDDILTKINNIKNIIAIHYYDLSLTTNKDQISILPGFLVFYDGSKSMFLCSRDEGFELFIKKLREVYECEKNNMINSNSFFKNGIIIDDFTRKMLESSKLDEINNQYEFYEDKESFSRSLLFEKDKVKFLFPIIKYHLQEVLKLFNMTISFENDIKGYNGNYNSLVKVNGNPLLVSISIRKKEFNNYYVIVSGILNHQASIRLDISFNKFSINVNNNIAEFDFEDNYNYQINDENIKLLHQTVLDKKVRVYEEKKLDKAINPYPNLTNNSDIIWYQLPWNSLYGFIIQKEIISDSERIIRLQNYYLGIVNDDYVIRENITKRYKRESTGILNRKDLILNSSESMIIGLKNNYGYLIETSFNQSGVGGFYKKYLAGKYFYHFQEAKDLSKINLMGSIVIDRKKDVFDKTDLLKGKVYCLIRKENE